MPVGKAKALKKSDLESMSDEELNKLKSELPAEDEETVKTVDEEIERRKSEPTDETVEDVEETSVDTPLGAQVLASLHASLKDLSATVEAAKGPLENVEVKSYLDTLLEGLATLCTEVEGLHVGQYPDAPALAKSDTPAEGESEPTEEDRLKTWLQSGRTNGLQLNGLGGRLKGLATAKNLTKPQRQTLAGVVKHLSRISAEAKAKSVQSPAVPPELAKEVGEIKALFNTALQQLAAIAPKK